MSESRRRWASQLKPRADLPSIFFSLKRSCWFFFFFNYLFLAALGSFSVATSRGSSLLVVQGLLVVWLLLFWSTGSRWLASVVVVPGL